ncbi:sensor histidine kinase [Roseivirga sp. 4D4]|uniref:sensor histidine kinase n=1 Tax=Roseivirga sp. 4D4 TaxID=1889784 RepID=UPI00147B34C9|nr:sensor histidine kinase [Roseivirga sp. 4D4]
MLRLTLIVFATICFLGAFPALGQESNVLDLRSASFEKPIAIDGAWDFYWSELIEDPSSAESIPIIANVPHQWPDLELNGATLPRTGFGTYIKKVRLPSSSSDWGLEIPHFFSAYNLYVNGDLLHSSGQVAKTREDYSPQRVPKIVSLASVDSNYLEIVIQVANFDHHKSGFFYNIEIGDLSMLERKFNRRLSFSVFVAGGLFICGLIVIFFSIVFRQLLNQVSFFGMFSLAILYHILGSDTYPLHIIFPNYDFYLALRVESLTAYLAALAGGLFVFNFYDRQTKPWMKWFVFGTIGAFLLSSLVLPPIYVSEVYFYSHIVLIAFNLLFFYLIVVAKVRDGFAPPHIVGAFALIYLWSFMEIFEHLDWVDVDFTLRVSSMVIILILSNLAILASLVYQVNNAELTQAEMGYQKNRQTMLSLISHEIKMPIASLQMNMEMLKMSSERPEKFEKVKDKIVGLSLNAVETIKRMLHDFIYFMSLDQKSNDQLSFDDIKCFISDNWSLQLYANASVDLDLKQYPTDKLTLKYILNTVVGNAEKYTKSVDKPVEIHLEGTREAVTIEVRDFGIGMSEEQLAKMGTEQAKIDENQEITGMGFYLAKELAQRLGHELSITSRGGEGTSVFVQIKRV